MKQLVVVFLTFTIFTGPWAHAGLFLSEREKATIKALKASPDNFCAIILAHGLQLSPLDLSLKPNGEVRKYSMTEGREKSFNKSMTLEIDQVDKIDEVAQYLDIGGNDFEIARLLRQHIKNSRVEIELKLVLPAFARRVMNHKANCHEPNCYNTALNFGDANVGIKYTSPEEFDAQIKERYVELAQGEQLRFGDIVVLYHKPFFLFSAINVHAATYLGSDFFFHKAGDDKETPYVVETWTSIYQDYHAAGIKPRIRVFRMNKPVDPASRVAGPLDDPRVSLIRIK